MQTLRIARQVASVASCTTFWMICAEQDCVLEDLFFDMARTLPNSVFKVISLAMQYWTSRH
ncbi:hypothetical protein SCLCIDRAFT_841301 [Scleroderma citrinum Foug A]|uniref:Uncharacterized protein n=1 Tax=Scleroderma citrinum Foug A TaxID=1036808 RepID=A0A0C3E1N9_9AGAM|nr:hypothetical protein SCLCIDRAFT_841301 [Scleroderma citrinum Foug A]